MEEEKIRKENGKLRVDWEKADVSGSQAGRDQLATNPKLDRNLVFGLNLRCGIRGNGTGHLCIGEIYESP